MADDDGIPDDMTELYDAQVPRVDLVGKGANGMPFLIAKQTDGQPGLLDPAYVRDLITKADAERPAAEGAETRETVTMSGSPAAIAALIHGAPVRKAAAAPEPAYEQIVKAKYNADELKRMAASGAAMKDESYPIADREDLTRAVHAVGRGGADHDAIRRHVARRAKALGASSEIPDNWAADGSLKKEDAAMAKAETAPHVQTAEPVAKDLDAGGGMPLDEGMDGLDPTVVLACPDQDAPGDPGDPGSPAWEAIDAATARKWTAIAARLRSALGIMSDREMLESATADPSDADAALDLDDAACAVDYAISVLAPFAVDEQAESDEGAMAIQAVGKALAGVEAVHLDTVESLGAIRKAGRALSTANETALRTALKALQQILASLPKPPDAPTAAPEESGAMTKEAETVAQPVAETVEGALTDRAPLGTAKDPASGEAPAAVPGPGAIAKTQEATGGDLLELVTKLRAALAGQQAAAGAVGEPPAQGAAPGPAGQVVAKAGAEKAPQMPVYDAKGNLMGVVDPAELTRLAEPATPAAPAAKTDTDAAATEAPAPAPQPGPAAPGAPAGATPPTDLAPQPPAAAGTPADAAPDEDAMAKTAAPAATSPAAAPAAEPALPSSTPADVLKAAPADHSATQEQVLAKQAENLAELVNVSKALEERDRALEELIAKQAATQQDYAQRLARLENAPPVMAIASNGAIPPAHLLRGQDHGTAAPDPATGRLLKERFRTADDATEQKQAADALTVLALEKFQAMQQAARRG